MRKNFFHSPIGYLGFVLTAAIVAACTADAPSGGSDQGAGAASASSSSSHSSSSHGSSSSSSSSHGSSTASSSSSGGGAGGANTGGSDGSGGSFGILKTCQKECTADAECCAPGDTACPSDTYPHNAFCAASACTPPICSTGDCSLDGPVPGTLCMKLGYFYPTCTTQCTQDSDCPAGSGQTCSFSKGGNTYCFKDPYACATDADCGGHGSCQNNYCGCLLDADCGAGYSCE